MRYVGYRGDWLQYEVAFFRRDVTNYCNFLWRWGMYVLAVVASGSAPWAYPFQLVATTGVAAAGAGVAVAVAGAGMATPLTVMRRLAV